MKVDKRTYRTFFALIIILMLFNLSLTKVFAKNIDFQEHQIVEGFAGVMSVDAVDLDGDGDIDILGASESGNEIAWWENDGTQNFTKRVITNNFVGVFKARATDLDNDGDIDILGAAEGCSELAWWKNDGTQNFTKYLIAQYTSATSVNNYDVDGDGDIDLLSTARNDISWWENDGQEVFTQHVLLSRSSAGLRSYVFHIYAADLDNDNDIDIVGGDNNWGIEGDDNTIFYWLNDGNENFVKYEIPGIHYAQFHGLRVSDVDSDGNLDICCTSPDKKTIDWFKNDGELNFTRYTAVNDFQGANSVFVADIDGDGDNDLLGAAYTGEKISWFENDGNQEFTEHVIVTDYEVASHCLAFDIDQDGDLDVVGATWSSKITWWESSLSNNGSSIDGLEIISVIAAGFITTGLKRRKEEK